tara:strand:+ start:2778 stop:4472 length:1695 start_codon:yes stop_codon:yes gene_type:complete
MSSRKNSIGVNNIPVSVLPGAAPAATPAATPGATPAAGGPDPLPPPTEKPKRSLLARANERAKNVGSFIAAAHNEKVTGFLPGMIATLFAIVNVIIIGLFGSKFTASLSWPYVACNILVMAMVVPFILQGNPSLYSNGSQLVVALAVLILDWVSLREDKTRFSERENFYVTSILQNGWISPIFFFGFFVFLVKYMYKSRHTTGYNSDADFFGMKFFGGIGLLIVIIQYLFRPEGLDGSKDWYKLEKWQKVTGRTNSTWTGVLAHLLDVVQIFLICGKQMDSTSEMSNKVKVAVLLVTSIYAVAGLYYIYYLNADGGESDVRIFNNVLAERDPASDFVKTTNAPRLWPDFERGVINLVITWLGVIASWQVVLWSAKREWWNDTDAKTWAIFNPFMHLWRSGEGVESFWDIPWGNFLPNFLMFVGPSVANLINTSYQFSAQPCFDDLPDLPVYNKSITKKRTKLAEKAGKFQKKCLSGGLTSQQHVDSSGKEIKASKLLKCSNSKDTPAIRDYWQEVKKTAGWKPSVTLAPKVVDGTEDSFTQDNSFTSKEAIAAKETILEKIFAF